MGGRTFVVGDIHGCPAELEVLLQAIVPASGDTVVFLGDYIDRGPDSKTVVEHLLRLREEGPRCIFLKGNHEDMLLDFMGLGGRYGGAFLLNGGKATLLSYGMEGCPGSEVAKRLPSAHREFLRDLETTFVCGKFLCVHAGINPLCDLEQQNEEDLLWIREEFIRNRHRLPYTVLFGHTPQREVFLDLPYKIGLDTGLVYSNKLSCIELQSGDLVQVRRGERRAQYSSLAKDLAAAGRAA